MYCKINFQELKFNKLVLILIVSVSIFLASCDPESCRGCETFNFDLTDWSIMDDTVKATYVFIDENYKETKLQFEDLELSEPYTECGIASSPNGVYCELTKKIKYFSDSLDFKFIIYYQQIELPGGNIATNNCNYLIELLDEETGEHLLVPPMDLFAGIDTINILEPLDEYKIANEIYTNVYRRKIENMIVYSSYETINAEYVEPKLNEIYYQIPNGIIGLTLENGKKLILKE
ncbi:MAG: hypothetical protein R2825_13880 [Saprospiraceae bacterium]